jgi:hypothetical protein
LQRERLGAAGRQQALNEWRWEQTVAPLCDLLAATLNGATTRPSRQLEMTR